MLTTKSRQQPTLEDVLRLYPELRVKQSAASSPPADQHSLNKEISAASPGREADESKEA